MKQIAAVDHSGNSNVTVNVDTKPMAYAMISCLFATGRFDENEINDMMRSFEDMDKGKNPRFYKGRNDLRNVKIFPQG